MTMRFRATERLRTIILVLALVLPYVLQAESVSLQKAMETANKFYYGNLATKGGTDGLKLLFDSRMAVSGTKSSQQAPSYYVFAPAASEGFVIIAGDDIIRPVLGYSFESRAAGISELPPALKEWLGEIDRHIELCRNNGATASDAVKSEWDAVASGQIQAKWARTRASDGEHLLETALWGQGTPFNNECPLDGGKRAKTGCVATAIGIIMHYHKWPDAGVGITGQYTTKSKGITVKARNLETPYDWKNMLSSYKNVSYTSTQSGATARLLADIGAVYTADYKEDATSATTGINEMYKYFKYDSGMSLIARKDYFEEEFDNILKNEIDNKRPVLYSGRSDADEGHAFVVDGYDNAGNFHINWGWSGSSNGYFAITSHNYTNKQRAFIKIQPATGKENVPEYWITLYNSMVSNVVNPDNYIVGEYFMIQLYLNNRTGIDFNGHIRLAVVDRNNNIKEWISDERSIEIGGRFNTNIPTYKGVTLNAKLGSEPEIGDRIRLYYRMGGQDWQLVMTDPVDWETTLWELPVADQKYIRESTSAKYDHTKKTLTFTYKSGVVPTVLYNGTVVTDGVETTPEKIVLDVKKMNGKEYVLRLEKKKELEEISFSVESFK